MTSPFDYPACIRSLMIRGQQFRGEGFNINKEDYPVMTKLLCWFMQDEAQALKAGIDLRKGIMLTGPVGCGKSSIMKIIRGLVVPQMRFLIKPCDQIAWEFTQEGYQAIWKYAPETNTHMICYDDLGFESVVSYFGSTCSTMEQVLYLRHRGFIDKGIITHITTNLNSNEIEDRYGARIRSRMREMFNVISFPPGGKDKR